MVWGGQKFVRLTFLGLSANVVNFILFKKLPPSQDFLLYAVALTSLLMQTILLASLGLLAVIN